MIDAYALIQLFIKALNEHWGYIWGTAGIMWTSAKQQQKVQYMINKYGNNWKKNADAKNDNYYSAAMYGEKWIGHTVTDCSGLFAWAFKVLGSAIAHGSNSIYDRYCTEKGKLNDTLKKTLTPGSAVFTGDASKHGHIGLYIGDGKVIEASGTIAGVCVSNLSAGKWTYWGWLKNVSISSENAPKIPSSGKDDNLPMKDYPTLKRGSKGEYVSVLQQKLILNGYPLPHYGIDGDFGSETERAVKAFQSDHGLTADGVVGQKTWKMLNENSENLPELFTVTVKHLTTEQADKIIEMYKDAVKQKE